MGSNSTVLDPTQVRTIAAQQAQLALGSWVTNVWPKYKAEWIKDVQVQGASVSSQIFKFDPSLIKYDEKGLTIAGKPVFEKLSLNYLVEGRAKEKKKAEEEEEKRLEKKAAEAARTAEKERVANFEEDLKEQVKRARARAREAQDDARKAHEDAKVAGNLLRSANSDARRAIASATQATRSFAALE